MQANELRDLVERHLDHSNALTPPRYPHPSDLASGLERTMRVPASRARVGVSRCDGRLLAGGNGET